MRYLIDPNFVTSRPYNLIPDTLAYLTGIEKIRNFNWVSRPPKKPYSIFDGIDLNFTLSGLFQGEENEPRWNKINKIKKQKWQIFAFHGGHENLAAQFNYMETNLAEDTELTRTKIRNQIRVARYLSSIEKPVIVFHPGMVGKKTNDFRGTLKNLYYAVKEAEKNNLIIALENMPVCDKGYFIGSDYEDLRFILKKIKSPHLKVCFDWGHANNYAQRFAKENGENQDFIKNFSYHREIIRGLNKEIIYAHIHYNKNHLLNDPDENDDEHLPLTRIPENEFENYKQTIEDLVIKTSIKEYGFMLLELMPKKVFGFYEFWPSGSTRKEQYQSLEIIKKILSQRDET